MGMTKLEFKVYVNKKHEHYTCAGIGSSEGKASMESSSASSLVSVSFNGVVYLLGTRKERFNAHHNIS